MLDLGQGKAVAATAQRPAFVDTMSLTDFLMLTRATRFLPPERVWWQRKGDRLASPQAFGAKAPPPAELGDESALPPVTFAAMVPDGPGLTTSGLTPTAGPPPSSDIGPGPPGGGPIGGFVPPDDEDDDATEPPGTEPPVTEPPVTGPPTQPPVTPPGEPPVTEPPVTTPPGVVPQGPVPEPAVWTMMILGMGFVGAAMRRRRTAGETVAAA